MSLTRLLEEGIPPPDIFNALSKKWTMFAVDNEALETAACSLRAAINLTICARDKTGWHPQYSSYSCGSHAKGVEQPTFLTAHGDGLVSVLHSLFCIVRG